MHRSTIILAALAGLGLAGVASAQQQPAPASALARMAGPDGADLGTVTFKQTPSGMLHVIVEMTNIPAGTHGMHVHEKGVCDAAGGFESAGGHIAGGKQHGVLNPDGPHPGDFPNVHVGEGGVLKVEYFSSALTLAEGENGLIGGDGSAVVIHADPDDYQSDPAGHSGHRIACGVIEQPA